MHTVEPAADLTKVIHGLRGLLDVIRDGGLTASSGEVARLEGALSALESLAGLASRRQVHCDG